MRLSIFMYHRVLPKNHSDAISVSMFQRQLDYLQKHYRILTPEETTGFILGTLEYTDRRPAAALSFDDGWLDNWLFATPVLKERSLKAILAMSAGYLGNGAVRESESDEVLYVRSQRAEDLAVQGDFRFYLNSAELKAMQDSGCWQIEAHGCIHRKGRLNVSRLALPQNGEKDEAFRSFLAADLKQCRNVLKNITGHSPEMLFWPWGHYTTQSVRIASEAGFKLQFTVAKGSVRYGGNKEVLPRIGVSPKWFKFRKNCLTFRHGLFIYLHDLFHAAPVCFDQYDKKDF